MNYTEFCQTDITLRNYQQEAKEKIFSQWNCVDNILYQMPTGTGKTRLFTSIIRDINVWGLRHNISFRILIIAHRSELIEQSSRSLDKYHIKHGVLAGTMKDKRDLTQSIQVASIQTITHPAYRDLIDNLAFDFIIIDEAHHAIANSYQKLWRFCPDSKKLGVTASPWRMNNSGFAKIFDAYVPSMTIKEFIQKGWLATYKYYSIPQDSKIQKSIDSIQEFDIEGDYKTSALVDVIDTSQIRAQLYQSYKDIAWGKKGIIYSISRIHSEHICAQYRSQGVRIENIDSKIPTKLREKIIQEFKNGDIDIIVNVDIFSEGFDCPDIEFIQLARPTKSLVKYIQQVGRGLRKNGDKQCIILDNVGMYSRFGLPDEDRDWEAFFYGEGKIFNERSVTREPTVGCRDISEVDLSEGNEKMVLIQDAESLVARQSEENTAHMEDSTDTIETVSKPILKKFLIKSKTFYSGRYRIEEDETGYYVCNARNNKRTFLIKIPSIPGGSIVIQKDSNKNTFIIMKQYKVSNNITMNNTIVGYIKKDGLLLKFSSFDKTIECQNVSV